MPFLGVGAPFSGGEACFDLNAGVDYYPIADESIDFGTGDPAFDTAPAAGTVTQSVTATFSVNAVAETFFKAAIEPIKSYEPEELGEQGSESDPEQDPEE